MRDAVPAADGGGGGDGCSLSNAAAMMYDVSSLRLSWWWRQHVVVEAEAEAESEKAAWCGSASLSFAAVPVPVPAACGRGQADLCGRAPSYPALPLAAMRVLRQKERVENRVHRQNILRGRANLSLYSNEHRSASGSLCAASRGS